jgi:hypothetical protein
MPDVPRDAMWRPMASWHTAGQEIKRSLTQSSPVDEKSAALSSLMDYGSERLSSSGLSQWTPPVVGLKNELCATPETTARGSPEIQRHG